MTEKRFNVDNHCNLYDNEHNVFYPVEDSRENIELLCKRLNNLEDENKQLKYTLSAYMVDLNNCKGKCSTLEIENEHLKQSLKNKMESDAHWEKKAKERVDGLEKENEELKKDLEILVHLVDWRDKLEKEWWRCEHFTNPLGVAFCSKNEDFCKRGECGDI